MTAVDWSDAALRLRSEPPGPNTDALIDSLCEAAETEIPSEAAPVLVHALNVADSVFVRARTAHALSLVAPDGYIDAADALTDAWKQQSADDFLASELLYALGSLALRNMAAYAACLGVLVRIHPINSPFLLIRAAKVIGRLERERGSTGLRERLDELAKSELPAVQAEVYYQQGLLTLSDALLAPDVASLEADLRKAQLIFLRAEASEEIRDDASAFVLLLDAALELFETEPMGDRATRIDEKVRSLSERIGDPNARSWFGYRTPVEQMFMLRVLQIGDALRAMATAASETDT
jgi:hypothetical protein